MNFQDREKITYRIIAGYVPLKIGVHRLKLVPPSPEILLRSIEVYEEVLEEGQMRGLMSQEQALAFAKWREQDENQYSVVLPKQVDYWKLRIFECRLKPTQAEEMRKMLAVARKELARLSALRSKFDFATPEGTANLARQLFLIEQCTQDKNGVIDWHSKEYSSLSVSAVLSASLKEYLDDSTLREIARSMPWAGIWAASKSAASVFGGPAVNLTNEQQRLITFSRMYDSIMECPDCPSEDIIEDDDMLDGWLIFKRKEREQARKEGEGEGIIRNKKIAQAGEVFLPVANAEENKIVDDLNPSYIKVLKKKRDQVIVKKGEASQLDFSDVKQDIAMEMARRH